MVLATGCCAVNFLAYFLFTDVARFTREGVFNSHNGHVLDYDNPHAIRPHAYQRRFSVNVWTGIGARLRDWAVHTTSSLGRLDQPHFLAAGLARTTGRCALVYPETYLVTAR